MAEGTPDPTGEGFGFYDRIEAPEEAPAEPNSYDPAQPAAPEAPVEGEPSEQQLYAGRYQSVQDLEQGYKEIQRAFTERSQKLSEIEQRLSEQDQILQLAAPLIQERLVAENPAIAEELEFAERVQPLIEQRLAPIQEEAEQARANEEFLRTVSDFRQRHPDVPPNSPADFQLAQVIAELDLVKEDPEALEVAYEAVRDPRVRFVLNAEPHLAENDAGMQMARLRAGQLASVAPTPPNGVPQGGPAQQATPPSFAFVEHGSSGAPTQGAPGAVPDGMPEVVELWKRERQSPLLR